MEWYYAEGGKQQGPVSEEEFGRLVESGVVQAGTLVWREGMTNWQPYQQVSGAVQLGAGPGQGGILCSQCGKVCGPEEVTHYGDAWVCANCSPQVLQRFHEGRPGSGGDQTTVSPQVLLSREYTVDAAGCLDRSWGLFKNNAGSIVGATLLVYLIVVGVNIIPYLGSILALIFTGPLMGGLWCFYLRFVRGYKAEIGDAFGGFGPRFSQLLLANVVTGILAGLCVLPALVLALGIGVSVGMAGESGGGEGSLSGGLVVVFTLVMVAGIAGYIYLTTCWFFTLPLVADKGLRFWPAMELGRKMVMKHWWGTFWVILVASLLTAAGVLLCFVGVLLTGPVAMGLLAFHYERVFGDLQPAND